MRFSLHEWALLLFTLAYVVLFATIFFLAENAEFLGYIVVIVFFLVLIGLTLRRARLPLFVLWGLSLWGLLHVAGGGVQIAGDVLYAYQVLPLFDGGGDFFILKYDQVVHAFGFAVATCVMYYLLAPQLIARASIGTVLFVAIAAGMGLGALNELIEFAAVLIAPETGVGGYENTLLDLTFNALGALSAAVFIWTRHYRRR